MLSFLRHLYKFHKYDTEMNKKVSWLSKVFIFIHQIFNPKAHPESSKRIEELSNKLEKDYKDMYPKQAKELNIILQDIKATA